MNPFIQIENITYKYRNEELALDGVSLGIEKGSFVAIVGHNGSGKSTLAKHLNAILLPTSGRVLINDMDTSDPANTIEIRRTVGAVFQNPDNQLVAAVVEEDVAFAPENLGVPPSEIRERVDKALKDVGMYDYREHAPHRLSGGQKQRVAIAGVIAMRPGCIVFDEPTAMLDPSGRREVLATIGKLRDTYGITMILVTHHMNEAALADRLIVMNRGKIFLDGTPEEIFSQVDRLAEAGMNPPHTVMLLHRLKEAGWDIPDGALTHDGCAEAIRTALGVR
ncbi:MAG: energy-coupling factor transporter ATPase [Oscillospiraceae bacterium]|nr:energy-coupling factor transporter ATPase [Oscillospiraceae bacterium]